MLAAIFQHSAAVILVARRADISSVADLRGRALMDTPGSDDIAAMLKREGVDYQSMLRVPHEGNPRDLLAGRADAMIAYSTNEPFVLEQLGAAYRTFSPAASGIDFYGDNLCTSEAEVQSPSGPGRGIQGGEPERLGLCACAQGGHGRSDPAQVLGEKEPRRPAV